MKNKLNTYDYTVMSMSIIGLVICVYKIAEGMYPMLTAIWVYKPSFIIILTLHVVGAIFLGAIMFGGKTNQDKTKYFKK